MFTEQELQTLCEARLLLKKHRENAQSDATKLLVGRTRRNSYEEADAFDLGFFAMICNVANDAIFDVMNVAAHYVKDPLAKQHMHDGN